MTKVYLMRCYQQRHYEQLYIQIQGKEKINNVKFAERNKRRETHQDNKIAFGHI